MGPSHLRRTRTMRTALIIVAITLAFAACADEMRADEAAVADLYQQQSELFDSLLQKPAENEITSSRAEKVKEIDAKVARLNKHYKKPAKGHKKDVELSLVQDLSSQKAKRAKKVKEVNEKVAVLNKRYMSKKGSAKAQPKKQGKAQHKKQVKAQKKKKKQQHAVEITLLQDFSSRKAKRASKKAALDRLAKRLNAGLEARGWLKKTYRKKKAKKIKKKAKTIKKKAKKIKKKIKKKAKKIKKKAKKKADEFDSLY